MRHLRRAWWYLTVLGAAWTGLMKPYVIAFEAHPGQRCGAASTLLHLQHSFFVVVGLTVLTVCCLLQAVHRHRRSD